jgi:hypothetical protein
MWTVAKSFRKSGGPKTPSEIHDPLGPIFYPIDKANRIADCLENKFREHDLCNCERRRHAEAQVEDPVATADEDTPVNFWPCDVSKDIQSLKLEMACGFDGIPNECLRHLPKRRIVHLTHLFNHCLRLGHFPTSLKEAKIITLPKPSEDPKLPQNMRPISLLSTKGKRFQKLILRTIQKHT